MISLLFECCRFSSCLQVQCVDLKTAIAHNSSHQLDELLSGVHSALVRVRLSFSVRPFMSTLEMMKVTMKNEIRRIGATHLCMVSSERVRSHCYLYLCNRYKKVWVRACARMRQTLHSHTHFMTIRLIEQNFKWFISFGLFNWKYKYVVLHCNLVIHFW